MEKKRKKYVSKSDFMKYVQCRKAGWLTINRPDLTPDISQELQAIYDNGHEVGRIAHQLFPSGIDISQGGKFVGLNLVKATQKALREKQNTVLFEPAFYSEKLNCLCASDILLINKKQYHLIEVKSSTSIKPIYEYDIAFQAVVIEEAMGIKVKTCTIVHLNTQYVRDEKLDIGALFKMVDVTEKVMVLKPTVRKLITEMNTGIKDKMPTVIPGLQCHEPYDCPYLPECLYKQLPDHSVFDIRNLSMKKKYELFWEGMIDVEELPNHYNIKPHQLLQINAMIQNKTVIDADAIHKFLKPYSLPFIFMDFETVSYGVPMYPNTGVYEKIPCQFSVQIMWDKDDVEVFNYIGDGMRDPREEFLIILLSVTDLGNAPIFVYHSPFEISILKKLSSWFPDKADKINQRIARIVDLAIPFREMYFYAPSMKGSWSIKSVLPAIMPSLSYDHLTIKNGAMASQGYAKLKDLKGRAYTKLQKALMKYCEQDTFALIVILMFLKSA
jgi:hypothetical protein